MEESTIPKKRVIVRMCAVIVVAMTLVVSVVGLLLGQLIPAAIVGLGASLLFVRTIRRSAAPAVLSMMSTSEVSASVHARIINVVDGLCVVSGDQRPVLRVVDSSYPLVMAVADPDEAGTIVVSSGFCAVMERVEVEAVMAHMLWRIRTGEVALTTFVLSLERWLSRVGLGAVARAMAARALDERVTLWADIAACQATRYPPALASALEKSEGTPAAGLEEVPTALWFASPEPTRGDTSTSAMFSSLGISHPSLAERIAVLKEI